MPLAPKTPPLAPGHLPVIGHFASFARDPLRFLERAASAGDVVLFDMAGKPSYLLLDPEHIDKVLVGRYRDFIKDEFLRDLRSVVGNGLLTSEGDFWRRQRRLTQPSFHRERVAAYAKVMVDHAERAAATLYAGQVRDIHDDMMRLTMRIVAETLFGVDVERDAEAVGEALEAIMERYEANARFMFPFIDKLPLPSNRRFGAALRTLDEIVYRVIGQRKSEIDKHGVEGRNDLLSMLLAARDEDGSRMTDAQLRDEILTLFLAGHETTALTLTYTWHCLAQNPEVDRAMRDELRQVLDGRSPTYDDLPKLKYVERVVQESMRLYPPAWSLGREATADVDLGPYVVPKGMAVWIPQWVVHRDARHFKDPLRFNPDRWRNDFAKTLPKYAYFPFGGGPRVCIGNAFAMMESTLLVATLAQRKRFDVDLSKPLKFTTSVTLRPKQRIKALVGNAD